MKKFNLYQDELVKCWERTYFEVEAETLEEAIQKVVDREADCYDSEVLYESLEPIKLKEGYSTREIYSDGEEVWSNFNK